MAVRLLRCRYCGEECEPRTGRPGYINAHEECHERWGDGDVEMVVASLSDEDGSWEIVSREVREQEVTAHLSAGNGGPPNLTRRLMVGLAYPVRGRSTWGDEENGPLHRRWKGTKWYGRKAT